MAMSDFMQSLIKNAVNDIVTGLRSSDDVDKTNMIRAIKWFMGKTARTRITFKDCCIYLDCEYQNLRDSIFAPLFKLPGFREEWSRLDEL
jgi:hypothetical protein